MIKRIYYTIKSQFPFKRFFTNFFINGKAWKLFTKKSHYRNSHIVKYKYSTLDEAKNSAKHLEDKHKKHFTYYKCMFCDGYHVSK